MKVKERCSTHLISSRDSLWIPYQLRVARLGVSEQPVVRCLEKASSRQPPVDPSLTSTLDYLVVDAAECLGFGAQARRARLESFLRRPPRARRSPVSAMSAMALSRRGAATVCMVLSSYIASWATLWHLGCQRRRAGGRRLAHNQSLPRRAQGTAQESATTSPPRTRRPRGGPLERLRPEEGQARTSRAVTSATADSSRLREISACE